MFAEKDLRIISRNPAKIQLRRWAMKVVGLGLSIITVALCVVIGSGVVSAVQGSEPPLDAWTSRPIRVISQVPQPPIYDDYRCEGELLAVAVEKQGIFPSACVFGATNTLRVAKYQNNGVSYAVAFPYDTQFYELRGVCPINRCVYNAVTDVFVEYVPVHWGYGATVHQWFTRGLTRHTDTVRRATYFQFEPQTEGWGMGFGGESRAVVGASTLSPNGQWALMEYQNLGFVRVHLQSGEARLVSTTGTVYGHGSDPHYELAITNNGRYGAVVGKNASIDVIIMTDECGESLRPGMETGFSEDSRRCNHADIELNQLFPGFDYALFPKFDSTGTRLSLAVQYVSSKTEKVVLSSVADTPETSTSLYVALGDSFVSGEGETSDHHYQAGTNTPNAHLKCHTSIRSYPYLVGTQWGLPAHNVACSGAQTIDIISGPGYTGQGVATSYNPEALHTFTPGVAAQADFVSFYTPQVASIGIGGNDAGLIAKLKDCLSPGTCAWVNNPEQRIRSAKEIEAVFYKVSAVIQSLKQNSPQSALFIVGYPKIFDTSPSANCSLVTNALLNADEREFANQAIHYLNQVLRAAAISNHVQFVDVETVYAGYELCGIHNGRAVNGIRFGDDIAPIDTLAQFRVIGAESFHPTPLGHRLVADAILASLPTAPKVSCGTPCSSELPWASDPPPPSTYWGWESFEQAVSQLYVPEMGVEYGVRGERVTIASPAALFAPNSAGVVELHSDPQQLATFTADADGSVVLSVVLPDSIEEGYHSLRLKGESPTGRAIDVYTVLAITETPLSTQSTQPTPPTDQNRVSPTSQATNSTPRPKASMVPHKHTSRSEPAVLGVFDSFSPFTMSQQPVSTVSSNVTQAIQKPSESNKNPTPSPTLMPLLLVIATSAIVLIGASVWWYRRRQRVHGA